MSNRWAGVRGWAGVGACSAEGVWDGPNPAGGRRGDPEAFEGRQVCIECSRKPVKQHICCFYWLTRGGEVAAVGLAGADFRYTKSFRAAGVRFYLHKLFRAAGRRILSTQSFRAAGVLWLRFLSLCFVR